MRKPNSNYRGDQYDDIEKLFDDAEKLISNPNTRQEGRDLLALANSRIAREKNRINYAAITGQMPSIPALEPAVNRKALSDGGKP